MRYGQRAAGTHPTGMHSCYIYNSKLTRTEPNNSNANRVFQDEEAL